MRVSDCLGRSALGKVGNCIAAVGGARPGFENNFCSQKLQVQFVDFFQKSILVKLVYVRTQQQI